ncbi:MAG: ThuA domain-containing protein [Balneolales bacterium]
MLFYLLSIICLNFLLADLPEQLSDDKSSHVLVFTKVNGFQHESRTEGAIAIKRLGLEHDFQTTITSDSTFFSPEILNRFDAVVFMSTSGTVLGQNEKKAFKEYIHNGGGFVGVHSATTTEYDWEWFGQLVGAYFDGHPKIQQATIDVVDRSHPSTTHLSEQLIWEDEWYNWQNELADNVNVLLTVDEDTYEGGNHSDYHPISWYHHFEGGRSWYTALGHEADYYSDPVFLQHLLGGLQWASGRGED